MIPTALNISEYWFPGDIVQSPACCGTILRCQKKVWMVICIGVHCWKDGCRECTHHSDSLRYSFLVWRSHAAVVCVCVSLFCLNGPEWLFFVHLPFLGIFVQVTASRLPVSFLVTWSAKALLWTLVACCTIYRYWDMAQLRWVLMFHHLLAATGVDEDSTRQQLVALQFSWTTCWSGAILQTIRCVLLVYCKLSGSFRD